VSLKEKRMRILSLTAMIVAGARHLAEHRDLSGLEVGIDDLQEAVGRVRAADWPLKGDRAALTLGSIREEIEKLLTPD
jgi:hypothetical protein